MFDLVDVLKRDDKKSAAVAPQLQNCALYFQTEECQQRVLEAFRYEGVNEPITRHLTEGEFDSLGNEVEVVFVDLTQADDVTKEARLILPQLPAHLSVVIIGSEDVISTIRQLKEMGLYYLFWPVNKEELIDFYRNVMNNRGHNRGVGSKRQSKKIAILTTKGGIGSTLICSELGHLLATEKKVSTLVVDHNHSGGNLDIMLGLKQFEKRVLQAGTLVSSIDNTYASGLIKRIDEHLSVLAVNSDVLDTATIEEYIQAITEQVDSEVNFMLQDYGSHIRTEIELENLVKQVDAIVLIMDPTVSSMRDFNRLIKQVEKYNSEGQVRILTVLNRSRPKQTDSITPADIERYALLPIDINVSFDVKANERLLAGKRLYQSGSPSSGALRDLAAMIMGEDTHKETSLLAKLKIWMN